MKNIIHLDNKESNIKNQLYSENKKISLLESIDLMKNNKFGRNVRVR